MNILAAITAGITGTIAMSMVLAMAPKMGMLKMDIVTLLGTMFGKANPDLGWLMHLMVGVIFALIYTYPWSTRIGTENLVDGLIFGSVHWLGAGIAMGMIPIMHAGIKSGAVKKTGHVDDK